MQDVFMAVVVFASIYFIIKLLADFLLRRKIIKMGHIEQAGILSPLKFDDEEVNKYPSLKWGLVALMAGIGLIVIELLRAGEDNYEFYRSLLPFGIELVFISSGFLMYFLFVTLKRKK